MQSIDKGGKARGEGEYNSNIRRILFFFIEEMDIRRIPILSLASFSLDCQKKKTHAAATTALIFMLHARGREEESKFINSKSQYRKVNTKESKF